MNISRRALVVATPLALVLRPAKATPESLRAAIATFTGGARVNDGRVTLEIAPLVENGNAVPVTVAVQSAMTAAEHVRRVALFTEMNPSPEVVVFHLGPHNGSAKVATRMRMATSQRVLALAELSDGTYWQTAVEVIVTLAACIEG
jgi:sulfur-oxidizing protein SoxY